MSFEELQEQRRELKTLRRDLKKSLRKWLSENNYQSTHINIDDDKIRLKIYGKPLRRIELSHMCYRFHMSLTLKTETRIWNINEDFPLYGAKGDELHIWEYWFR